MNYSSFLRTLSDLIEEKVNQEPIIKPSNLLASSYAYDPMRKKAFISYSHKDKECLDRLRIHLNGFLHDENENEDLNIRVDVWDDTNIDFGDNWKEEIKKAINDARLAVLLVSADFLNSDFIRDEELPPLYKAAEAKKLKIVPILLKPCAFKKTKLAHFQAINSDTKPLMGLDTIKQEEMWYQLAEYIYNFLKI